MKLSRSLTGNRVLFRKSYRQYCGLETSYEELQGHSILSKVCVTREYVRRGGSPDSTAA